MPYGTEPVKEQKLQESLLALFRAEALARGIEEPIGHEQVKSWLRFVVPEIEGAFGVPVYTAQEEMLARALDEIRRIFSQLGESPDKVLGYVFTGKRGGSRAQ
ncbi:hypothetical protein HOY82DRAFT_113679 [Tuber indicum]|nr:hypothetical protein HOY82DRAFT_113679 [Tuber indicum]